MFKPLQSKTINALVLTVTAALLLLSSCKKDAPQLPAVNSVSADIDGVPTKFLKYALALQAEVNGESFTSVQATDDKGNTVSLTIYGTLQAGKSYSSTNSDNPDRSLLTYSNDNNDDFPYFSDNGDNTLITLTKVASKRIEGTFSGKVSLSSGKSKVITNGKFNVEIVTD